MKKTENLRVKLWSSYIYCSMSVRKLWTILDNTLGIVKHVNCVCKPFYYQIRNIRLIRRYINDEKWKTLVKVLIISQLDYWQTPNRTVLHDFWRTLSNIKHQWFVSSSLGSYAVHFTVQDPVSHIQSIECNNM